MFDSKVRRGLLYVNRWETKIIHVVVQKLKLLTCFKETAANGFIGI
jgi:hypothetical protein